MLTGLLIGLREGVEAALIVGIVASYLVRTGNRRHLPRLWLGAGGAVAVSIGLGIVLWLTVGGLPEPYEQAFEGLTMVVATVIVTLMLFWMRAQSRSLRGRLEVRLAQAIDNGGAWGLTILAFTSVLREGIETSLFLFGQTTAADAAVAGGGPAVVAGAIAGLVVAAVLGYGIYRGSRRLDLRAFFTWTGIGLVFIAAGLASRAVHEFVEINVVRVGTQTAFDLRGVLPDGDGIGQFLHAILGYVAAPEVVTLAVYLAYVAVILGLYLLPGRRLPPARPVVAQS